jgi:hypothetical protein
MASEWDDNGDADFDEKPKKSKKGDDWEEGGDEWGANEEDGDWGKNDFAEDDTEASFVSTKSSKTVKKIGIKLYVDLCKQVMLAIRSKKTTGEHFDAASAVIQELYREFSEQQAEKAADQKKKEKNKAADKKTSSKDKDAKSPPKKTTAKQCQICFSDYDKEATPFIVTNCGHATGCTECFMKYVQNKIAEKDVTPWINCPEDKCYTPLHFDDVVGSGANTLELYQMADVYLHKMLARNENWIPCSVKECGYGFLVEGKVGTKMEGMACGVCYTKQTVEKKEQGLDEEFKKLQKEGKLKACPVCKLWTMKEYGICNVIQCGKCAIWWNWRTFATGKTSRELKEKARGDGSLWEPGELAFQQNLEQSNPKAFKELLERNGMKFDPNYRRGGWKADED